MPASWTKQSVLRTEQSAQGLKISMDGDFAAFLWILRAVVTKGKSNIKNIIILVQATSNTQSRNRQSQRTIFSTTMGCGKILLCTYTCTGWKKTKFHLASPSLFLHPFRYYRTQTHDAWWNLSTLDNMLKRFCLSQNYKSQKSEKETIWSQFHFLYI